MDTVNVLCLHGCNQSQQTFQQIMKNIVKLGEKQYNLKFFFTEAKFDHPAGGKTWYKKPLVIEDIGKIEYSEDLVKDTLNDVEQLIEENNIHALLGFSQGGNVVDTFITYRNNPNIKCAVNMSGYAFVDSSRKESVLPVLGVASKNDTIVPFDLTIAKYMVEHDKGHKIPTRKPHMREILKFLQTAVTKE